MRSWFTNSQMMSSLSATAGRLGMRQFERTCEMSDRRPCSGKSFKKMAGARPAKDNQTKVFSC
jgi:hypothetical protein